MEHWLIVVRAVGDLLSYAAAALSLAAVLADRFTRRHSDTDQ